MSRVLALLLIPAAWGQQSQSLFDPPQFTEDRFELAVDAGAHASAAAAGPALALTLLPLPALAAPATEKRLEAAGGPAWGWYLLDAGRPDEAVAPLQGSAAEGLAHLRAGRVAEARRVQESLPRGAGADWLQGHILEADGKALEAARWLARAVQGGADPRHAADRADHLLRHGAPKAAAEGLDAALGKHPGDLLLLLHQGRARFGNGDAAGALTSFQAARQADPADNRPLEMILYLLDAAPLVAARAVPLLSPAQSQRQRYALAVALLRSPEATGQDRRRAESLLRQAAPIEAAAQFELGKLLAETARTNEAILRFEASLPNRATREAAHYRLSRLLAGAGRAAAAERHLEAYRTMHKERLEREESERKARLLFVEKAR